MSIAVNNNYYTNPSGTAQGSTDYYKTGAKFIPDIWSGKLQVKYYAATCISEITNNDWEGEIKDQGDKVIIRSVPNITIRDYTKGVSLTSEVPSSTPIELNIDKGKYFQVVIDDVDAVQTDVRLMNAFTDDASEQMKITIEKDVFANIATDVASTNKGATAGAISANINLGAAGTAVSITKTNVIDYVVDMGLVLDEANVPESGRWLLIPSAMAARIKKSDLKDASVMGDSQSALRNGRIGMIDRFTVYSTNNLVPAAGVYNIFAGVKDGISWASQITKVETLRSTSTFGDIVRGLNVYGFKVTKPEALCMGVVTMG